jgi:ABC-type transport system substrate-binding protein
VRDTIPTLDPTVAYDEISYFALRLLWEPLLDYAPGSAVLVGRLAERWEVTENATTFHFWLRADSRFSDGTPVVAADVKFALERALRTPDSPFSQWLGDVTGASEVIANKAPHCAGISTPNERELVIHLEHPNAGFLYTLAAPFTAPQRESHVAAVGADVRRTPLGNGPYMLDRWSEGERFVVTRNPVYSGAQPAYPDEIEMLEGVARDTQFMMLEQGELDTAYRLAAPDLMWVKAQPRWRSYVKTSTMMNTQGFRFDVTQKPFDDVRVRRAFNYALDRAHVAKLLVGAALPAHGMLPPGVLGRDETLQPYPHDIAKARALLGEAGYGTGLEVELVTIADEDATKLAESFQADLAEVGVTMHISVVAFSVYLTALGKRGGPALAYAGWLGDSPDPTSFLDAKFASAAISDDASPNDSFYANPKLDGLLDAARTDGDSNNRIRLYNEAERVLADDPPWVWAYHEATNEVSQPYVKGMAPSPVWIRDFSTVWLDLDEHGERVER